MANKITIDDGSKAYEIENKQGEVLATFVFRPSDTNILDRYEKVKDFFDKFETADKEPDIKEYEKKLIEQMDYLTGADTGNTFFSIMGPFSPMPDGSLFCETCLNAVVDIINKELDIRLEKTKSHMDKYLQKYQPAPYPAKKHRRR